MRLHQSTENAHHLSRYSLENVLLPMALTLTWSYGCFSHIEVILKCEEMCLEYAKEFSTLFVQYVFQHPSIEAFILDFAPSIRQRYFTRRGYTQMGCRKGRNRRVR